VEEAEEVGFEPARAPESRRRVCGLALGTSFGGGAITSHTPTPSAAIVPLRVARPSLHLGRAQEVTGGLIH
jgi:hypothetical protein